MEPLTKKQVSQFRRLSDEEQKTYLRIRLHDEAEFWLEYFLRAQDFYDLLPRNLMLSPPQR